MIVSAFCREAALVLGLFALWQLAGSLSVMRIDRAIARGHGPWRLDWLDGVATIAILLGSLTSQSVARSLGAD